MSKVYHNSFFAMGTRFNLVFPSEDEEACEQLFRLIKSEVLRVESLLSYYAPESEVYKINQTASKMDVRLDDELFSIIEICIVYMDMTSGAYDITLRPIVEYLKNNNESSAMKGKKLISFMNDINLDFDKKTIHFRSDNIKIDFGGFGKGYALEKIKPILENSSIKNAFLSFGESSILVKGKHPNGLEWSVGIRDLFSNDKTVHLFGISDQSISSSSNYFLDDSGQLCHKINVINPFTGMPVEEVAIVTVKSASPLEAEILSTAFLVMDEIKIVNLIKKLNNVEAVKIIYHDKKPFSKIF